MNHISQFLKHHYRHFRFKERHSAMGKGKKKGK